MKIDDKVLTAKENSESWQLYLQLMQERPEVFRNEGAGNLTACPLEIVTDLESICEFENETNRQIGLLYKSPYSMLVVDLVRTPEGKCFDYERLIPAVKNSAVVCITRCGDRFILLKQYRHSMRDLQYAFVRGYGEAGLTGAENAAKEIREELGTRVLSSCYLGKVVADSGINGNPVEVYECKIADYETKKGYEGIENVVSLSETEIREWIAKGMINDGYTLAALSLLAGKNS